MCQTFYWTLLSFISFKGFRFKGNNAHLYSLFRKRTSSSSSRFTWNLPESQLFRSFCGGVSFHTIAGCENTQLILGFFFLNSDSIGGNCSFHIRGHFHCTIAGCLSKWVQHFGIRWWQSCKRAWLQCLCMVQWYFFYGVFVFQTCAHSPYCRTSTQYSIELTDSRKIGPLVLVLEKHSGAFDLPAPLCRLRYVHSWLLLIAIRQNFLWIYSQLNDLADVMNVIILITVTASIVCLCSVFRLGA